MGAANGPALEVVGVVGEARMSRLSREPIPAVYTPLALRDSGYLTIYLRSSARASALQDIVKQVVRQADGNARFREFQNLAELADQEAEEPRQIRGQTLAAGLLAALLAGVGLAGTLAQAAARQKREWGIRMALGLTGLVAGLAPALRAARTQPAEALRSE